MVFYYAMIVEGGIDLPRKHTSKKIVLTQQTTLFHDVCGGIFQTQGDGEIALRVWMDGDGQFGRSFEVYTVSSSLAETRFNNVSSCKLRMLRRAMTV